MNHVLNHILKCTALHLKKKNSGEQTNDESVNTKNPDSNKNHTLSALTQTMSFKRHTNLNEIIKMSGPLDLRGNRSLQNGSNFLTYNTASTELRPEPR